MGTAIVLAVVREILTKDLDLTLIRHREGQAIFKAIGDAGPAMGMIGTLIGLVQMLGSMSDPKEIAPAMAMALLTTLYRAMIANVIAIPIADKLALRSTDERLAKSRSSRCHGNRLTQGHEPRSGPAQSRHPEPTTENEVRQHTVDSGST